MYSEDNTMPASQTTLTPFLPSHRRPGAWTALWSFAVLAISLGCSSVFEDEDAEPVTRSNPVPSIMAALESQQISPGQAQQYLWAAFLGTKEQIPDALQASSGSPEQTAAAKNDAHKLMSQVFEDWDEYSGAEQWGIALSMSRLRTDLPPLKLVQRNSSAEGQDQLDSLFAYGEEHSIAFCRYAEYGYENKKLGFYDEFTADLPDCSGLGQSACLAVSTPQGQQACEFTADMVDEDGALIAINRCHTKRFWGSCEPGWLEAEYESRRQEFLHAAPTPYQKLGTELGWPEKTPEIARMALLHSIDADLANLPGATTFSSRSTTPYVIFQPGPFEPAACGRTGLAANVNHELFHLAQHYHRPLTRADHEEAMAKWFEDFVESSWDSEQSSFEVYTATPGTAFDERDYNGALALRVLFKSRPDVPFDLMRSRLLSGSSPVDLSAALVSRLSIAEREKLHTLSEQAYGMTINDLSNDTCPIDTNWRINAIEGSGLSPTVQIGREEGERIQYQVPGLSYEARLLEVDERVLVLNLGLQQSATTRTSIVVDGGGPDSERLIPLSPGANRLCFEGEHGERDCSCSDVEESELIPIHSLGLVSTQLDNNEQPVTVTVDAIKYGDKASCWRMVEASGVLSSYLVYEVEKGPIIRILENPAGLPDESPSCTAIFLENHEDTTYSQNIPQRPDTEMRCTIQAKVALPVQYSTTAQSETAVSGSYAIFGPRSAYREDEAHRCTPELSGPGQFGVTDRGTAYLGVLSSMMVSVDGGRAPMSFQHTISEAGDRMVLTRNPVSRDGHTLQMQVELEEVDELECNFAEGLWQRALAAHPQP